MRAPEERRSNLHEKRRLLTPMANGMRTPVYVADSVGYPLARAEVARAYEIAKTIAFPKTWGNLR
jgi:hypothetical protein